MSDVPNGTKFKEVKCLSGVGTIEIGELMGLNLKIRIKRERSDTVLTFSPVDFSLLKGWLDSMAPSDLDIQHKGGI